MVLKTMNELVSTIITTYNRNVKYVQEAIESVFSQTYNPIEIILVDDNGFASVYEKDLVELCKRYRVVYLPNEINKGAQFSRNKGIRASKGEFVALLDDDDIWENTKIEKQMSLFSDKSVGMVYCDGFSFDDECRSEIWAMREASIFDKPITFEMELFNDWIGTTSQVLIRRSVLDRVGLFDVDMPARQDYEMWLRICKEYKVICCPEKLVLYRVHRGKRISEDLNRCYRSYELILKKYKNDYNSNRYAKSKLLLRMFKTSIRMNKPRLVLRNLFRAIVCSPICVLDTIRQNISKKSFEEFYSSRMI